MTRIRIIYAACCVVAIAVVLADGYVDDFLGPVEGPGIVGAER